MKFKPCLAEFTLGKDNFFCSQPIILQKGMAGRRDDYGFGGMNVMFGGMNVISGGRSMIKRRDDPGIEIAISYLNLVYFTSFDVLM